MRIRYGQELLLLVGARAYLKYFRLRGHNNVTHILSNDYTLGLYN